MISEEIAGSNLHKLPPRSCDASPLNAIPDATLKSTGWDFRTRCGSRDYSGIEVQDRDENTKQDVDASPIR